MRFVEAKSEEADRAEASRFYIAECLRMIAHNTAYLAPNGVYLEKRLWDVMNPPEPDNRTGDEIIQDTLNQLGFGGLNG